MMAGNPGTWWSMINNNNNHNNSIPTSFYPVESSMVDTQEFPQSWSQLLMGVLASDEDKIVANNNPSKNLDQLEYDCLRFPDVDLKPEAAVGQEFRSNSNSSLSYNSSSTTLPSSWSQIVANNIPTWPSITSSDTNSKTKPESEHFNSVVNGGASKKAKVQSSNQPSLKIRKEKLGDRINALHQIVSPFGKTDTASVLTEAIGYIRFFQDQIEALSSPYLRNQQHSVEVHIGHCVIPEDSCHIMNRSRGLKGREASKQDEDGKNLRSRGLCLVPLSCTHDYIDTSPNNAADHCWAATSTSLVRGFP